MATVRTPLLSFDASGQLGKTLVFFPWKGLDCVRSYVIPANPNTAGQQAQRTLMANAVSDWHTIGLDSDDGTAWNRLATTLAAVMSGFNAFVSAHIDIALLPDSPEMGFDGAITDAGGGTFDATIEEGGDATDANVIWGYSPTSLINKTALAETANVWDVAGVAAVAGARIYCRFELEDTAVIIGRTGIYAVTLA